MSDAKLITNLCSSIVPCEIDLLIGMIIWPNSRRSISISTGREIADLSLENGAKPVAVFVDDSMQDMRSKCAEMGVGIAQLHGLGSRQAWEQHHLGDNDDDDDGLQWIDVRDVRLDSSISDATKHNGGSAPAWTIYDAKGGGTGIPFDWSRFERPTGDWILAGGLNVENVTEAVNVLQPTGLDVSSGVCNQDGCTKNAYIIEAFLNRVVEAYGMEPPK